MRLDLALHMALEELDEPVPLPSDPAALIAMAGGTPPLAAAMSGTTVRKSTEYRTASRAIQRARKGERTTPTAMARIRAAVTPPTGREMARKHGVTAKLVGVVYKRSRLIDGSISAVDFRVIEDAMSRRPVAAGDMFADALFRAYGWPGGAGEINDTKSVDLVPHAT